MKQNLLRYTIGMCLLCFLTILIPGYSEALDRVYEVQIDFSFDTESPEIPEVAGYRLYIDGNPLCEQSLEESQIMTCAIDTPGTFDFTLSALYINGRESPQSAPFQFSVTCEEPALVALQVLSGQSPQDIETLGSLAGTPVIDMADVIHSLRNVAQ